MKTDCQTWHEQILLSKPSSEYAEGREARAKTAKTKRDGTGGREEEREREREQRQSEMEMEERARQRATAWLLVTSFTGGNRSL